MKQVPTLPILANLPDFPQQTPVFNCPFPLSSWGNNSLVFLPHFDSFSHLFSSVIERGISDVHKRRNFLRQVLKERDMRFVEPTFISFSQSVNPGGRDQHQSPLRGWQTLISNVHSDSSRSIVFDIKRQLQLIYSFVNIILWKCPGVCKLLSGGKPLDLGFDLHIFPMFEVSGLASLQETNLARHANIFKSLDGFDLL